MVKIISSTFGSSDILSKIVVDNPTREFKLLSSSSQKDQMQLLDLSDRQTIFKTPFNYSVINQLLEDDFRGIFNFEYFSLSIDDKKIFMAAVNKLPSIAAIPNGMINAYALQNAEKNNELIMLTLWETQQYLNTWKKQDQLVTLNTFRKSQDNYYDQTYFPVNAKS